MFKQIGSGSIDSSATYEKIALLFITPLLDIWLSDDDWQQDIYSPTQPNLFISSSSFALPLSTEKSGLSLSNSLSSRKVKTNLDHYWWVSTTLRPSHVTTLSVYGEIKQPRAGDSVSCLNSLFKGFIFAFVQEFSRAQVFAAFQKLDPSQNLLRKSFVYIKLKVFTNLTHTNLDNLIPAHI